MRGLEITVILLTAVLTLTWTARRIHASEPVLLLLGGVLIGLVPQFRSVRLPPDLVLLIFLPPLLYAEALTISLRQILANLRTIVTLAVGLVLTTALTVAGTAHAFGMAWPMAFVLGAVLAPTDATAVASVARGMPRSTLTTMRAESLVNDGTALVVFAVAAQIAAGGHSPHWDEAIWRFVFSYAGGLAIGAAGGALVVAVRRRIKDRALESGLSALTPFAVYLPAQLAGASGVLAVVVSGLLISRASPLLVTASSRIQTLAFWDVTTFLLNGSLFVLVGMQLPNAVSGLRSLGLGQACLLAAAVCMAVIVTRLVYIHTVPLVVHAVRGQRDAHPRPFAGRQRLPVAWGGVRGAVSLAAALAVPSFTADGAVLRGRDVIVFTTAAVILGTLLLQGQSLPAVIRWSRLRSDLAEGDEERLARHRVLEVALDELPHQASRLGVPREVVARLERELHEQAQLLGPDNESAHHTEQELRHTLLSAKRTALVALRDARVIDDAVLRRVQETLDTEEMWLERRDAAAHGGGTSGGPRGGSPAPGQKSPRREPVDG
ncbi:Na+/H+ antiporter [Actinacidiphila rubida]|uniref:Sodium/proton antiporter, CPA1 family n=1 Tax=Actinacidiphila rubida TaxID=310780 RepID=A0A1H8PY90_9ACTN|nr:Na+/H+ antiporter [Actinacidiphila rubida]SEO46523.1 sodium/proton antiporter, CPA1 family [Actinacidiphila rubida]